MPAERLTAEGMFVSQSDVVGRDAQSGACFIRHAALSTASCDSVKSGDSINVNHMGPPLEREHEMPVDVHATAELTDDELNQIELFIDEHLEEQESQGRRDSSNYIVHPHTSLSEDGAFAALVARAL